MSERKVLNVSKKSIPVIQKHSYKIQQLMYLNKNHNLIIN